MTPTAAQRQSFTVVTLRLKFDLCCRSCLILLYLDRKRELERILERVKRLNIPLPSTRFLPLR